MNLTPDQLKAAQAEARRSRISVGQALINAGNVAEPDLIEFLAKQYGVRAVDLSQVTIEWEALRWLPKNLCEKYTAVPISKMDDSLVIAMADPSNIYAVDEIKFLLGNTPHEIVVASQSAIRAAIQKYPPSQPVG